MSNIQIQFFSQCLNRPVRFQMFLPVDGWDKVSDDSIYKNRTRKLLVLFHGYTGIGGFWGLEWMAKKYNFAIAAMDAENKFYLDGEATGSKYCSFVGEELLGYIREVFGLGLKREDTYALGLSMGGFGAMHTALAYPDCFGACGCMSSAFIIHQIARMKPGDYDEEANYEYYRQTFGNLETVTESDNNPEVLIKRLLKDETQPMPAIYMCCGTEDFLIEHNRQMDSFLNENKVEHIYIESPGIHDQRFWDEYQVKIVDWMMQ